MTALATVATRDVEKKDKPFKPSISSINPKVQELLRNSPYEPPKVVSFAMDGMTDWQSTRGLAGNI